MASRRPLATTLLAARTALRRQHAGQLSRPISSALCPAAAAATASAGATAIAAVRSASAAPFSTTAARPSLAAGPPPSGFRLPRRARWDEPQESALDRAGRFFLMLEMFRGMYVVLEQFFRPPYTIFYPFEKASKEKKKKKRKGPLLLLEPPSH
jgi:hypothetical protein